MSLIDHAILHPTATNEDLIAGCELAVNLGVATVCVKPYMIRRAVELTENSAVGVGTVIGFPHGSNSSGQRGPSSRKRLGFCNSGHCDRPCHRAQSPGNSQSYLRNRLSHKRTHYKAL